MGISSRLLAPFGTLWPPFWGPRQGTDRSAASTHRGGTLSRVLAGRVLTTSSTWHLPPESAPSSGQHYRRPRSPPSSSNSSQMAQVSIKYYRDRSSPAGLGPWRPLGGPLIRIQQANLRISRWAVPRTPEENHPGHPLFFSRSGSPGEAKGSARPVAQGIRKKRETLTRVGFLDGPSKQVIVGPLLLVCIRSHPSHSPSFSFFHFALPR